MKTKSTQLISLLFCFLLLFSLCLRILPIEIEATSTFYDNNELWVVGQFRYVSSSWGSPSDNLGGQTIKIYFSAESERCVLRNPYISNASSATLTGYLDNGMEFKIPFGGRVEVTQQHYSASQNRSATAYYDVIVNDMATNLLYRPSRNDTYITFISIGLLLFAGITLIKVVGGRD